MGEKEFSAHQTQNHLGGNGTYIHVYHCFFNLFSCFITLTHPPVQVSGNLTVDVKIKHRLVYTWFSTSCQADLYLSSKKHQIHCCLLRCCVMRYFTGNQKSKNISFQIFETRLLNNVSGNWFSTLISPFYLHQPVMSSFFLCPKANTVHHLKQAHIPVPAPWESSEQEQDIVLSEHINRNDKRLKQHKL